jgi:bacteriocin-like protein
MENEMNPSPTMNIPIKTDLPAGETVESELSVLSDNELDHVSGGLGADQRGNPIGGLHSR